MLPSEPASTVAGRPVGLSFIGATATKRCSTSRSQCRAISASSAEADRRQLKVMSVPPATGEQFLAKERKLWTDAVKLTGVTLD